MINSSASAGAAPSSSVPVSEESVEVSDFILRASDLARALKSTERSAEEYRERMEAVFVAYEIASAEEKKADAADASALRCG